MGGLPDFVASYYTLAGDCHPVRDAGVSSVPIEKRIEAAADAGYRGFGLSAVDIVEFRKLARWRDYKELRRVLTANGMRLVELEVIHDWFADGSRRAQSDYITEILLEAAAELGGFCIKVVGDRHGETPLEEMVEPFAALCARAKTSGAAIAIEPTPLTNLYSIEDCIRLIRHSGAANAGLDIDIWHMARANIAYEHLAAIPVSLIMAVELSDADREVRGTLYQDTMNWRRLCGDGQLDPAGFVAAIHRTGYAGPFSVEIISEEHRARTVTSAARLSIESARRLF